MVCIKCFCACSNPTVNANNIIPFFISQGGVAECKALHNVGVLMDAYLRAGNMVACHLATSVQGTGKK